MLKSLNRVIQLDLRALALFRIVLGSLIFFDLLTVLPTAHLFYSDSGVLPRIGLLHMFDRDGGINFYLFGGSVGFCRTLVLLHAIAALAYILGFQTRTATIILWLCLLSIDNRNPIAQEGGDVMFRLLVFWSMFLPVGRFWSMDAWKSFRKISLSRLSENAAISRPTQFVGISSAAIMLQVAAIYLVTSQTKSGYQWHTAYTAVQLALANPEYTSPVGTWVLRTFPNSIWIMNPATLWGELLFPLLLFIPWKHYFFRTIGIIGLTMLHLGIDVTMSVGFTSIANFAGLLVFIPPTFFESASRLISGAGQIQSNREVVIGMKPRWAEVFCGLCLGFVALWNLKTLNYPGVETALKTTPSFPLNVLRLDQKWTMFSPHPPGNAIYLMARGTLQNGNLVDLRTGELLRDDDFILPSFIEYGNDRRWRKYFTNLSKEKFAACRPYYADFICRQWNADKETSSPQRVVSVDLWLVSTPLLEDDAVTTYTSLLSWDCGSTSSSLRTKASGELLKYLQR